MYMRLEEIFANWQTDLHKVKKQYTRVILIM